MGKHHGTREQNRREYLLKLFGDYSQVKFMNTNASKNVEDGNYSVKLEWIEEKIFELCRM